MPVGQPVLNTNYKQRDREREREREGKRERGGLTLNVFLFGICLFVHLFVCSLKKIDLIFFLFVH